MLPAEIPRMNAATSENTRIVRKSSMIPAVREEVEPELEPLIPVEWEYELKQKLAYTKFVERCLENIAGF